MADARDVTSLRDVFAIVGGCEDVIGRFVCVGAVGVEEPRRQDGASSTGIVEAVGLARGAELVATEDAEELGEPELAGARERLDLGIFVGREEIETPNSRPSETRRSRVRIERILRSEGLGVATAI